MDYSIPTTASRTLEIIDSLINDNLELLKKYGVNYAGSRSPYERYLVANGFSLKLRLEVQPNLISAFIENARIPQGRLPKQRNLDINGTVANPLLAGQPIDAVFWDLINWFRVVAFAASERIPI
jgi:hypothetical protein